MAAKSVSRRAVLRSGAVALGAASASGLGGVGSLASWSTGAYAQNARLRVRRSVDDADTGALNSYRRAVTEMKRRSQVDANDPLGWTMQANVHRDHCPHGNWFFLPWHRAYLLAFEQICRDASGDPDFALPYWDWSNNPRIPAAFSEPNSPLLNTTRVLGANDPITVREIQTDFIETMLLEPNFEIFGSGRPEGQNNATSPDWQQAQGTSSGVESGPHNQVHDSINGDMGAFLSPLDPIFWLHHCNVDRLWVVWNQGNGGERHTNTTSPLWLNYRFNNAFALPGGTSRQYTVRDLQRVNPLGYSYGEDGNALRRSNRVATRGLRAAPPKLAKLDDDWRSRAVSVPVNKEARTTAPASVTVPKSATRSVAGGAAKGGKGDFRLPTSGQIPSRVIVIVADVVPPADRDVQMRVFVANKEANAQTPSTDPSYVGTISFFGTDHAMQGGTHAGHAGHSNKRSYAFDLTLPLKKMQAAGRLPPGDIDVQLVPVSKKSGPSKDVAITVGKVQISGNRI